MDVWHNCACQLRTKGRRDGSTQASDRSSSPVWKIAPSRRAAWWLLLFGISPVSDHEEVGAINSVDTLVAPFGVLADLRNTIADLVLSYGHERREVPFQLSSAGLSHDYIDGKTATSTGERLQNVAKAIDEITKAAGVTFDAVGGPTVGADAIAVAVAMELSKSWFFVRKEAKKHGKQKLIEGAVLAAGVSVVVVDDVATTGKSIIQALDALDKLGVEVVMVIPLVDRGELTRPLIEARGIPYEPIITYLDLGIDPVGPRV